MSALHVERSGQGALPLVLLHGWGLNLRVFDALRTRLSAQREVIAVDLPGHGGSAWDAGQADLAGQVAQLRAVLPARCALLGWSLGGQFALQLAHQHPDRIARLVLLATTPRFVAGADWPHGLASSVMARFAGQLDADPQRTVDEFLHLQLRGSREADASLQALQAALRDHGGAQPSALAAGLALLQDNDLRHAWDRLDVPTLLVAGQHDRITPAAAAQWMTAQRPGVRAAELPRAGHAPHLSHADAVVALLEDFLAHD